MHNKPHSEESKRRISESKKGSTPWNKGKKTGVIPWNKGIPMNEELKKKISQACKKAVNPTWYKKGHKFSEETLKKMSESLRGRPSANKGKHFSEELRRKLSESHIGQVAWNKGKKTGFTWNKGRKETRLEVLKRQGESHKGQIPWILGKTHSEKTRQRLSETHKGEKSIFWKGGISFEPYSPEWTRALKKTIRQRDNYICQICNKKGNVVHHIDYNKKNCNPNNLITLCESCHSKTGNNREKWIKLLREKSE